MRGRKPALKVVESGLTDVPCMPSWLPPEAEDEWNRILPDLIKRGVLTATDLGAVESYCLAWGTVRRCQRKLAEEGDTIETKAGPKRHPALQTLQQMMVESRRLSAELGLTPASRSKAGRAPAGESIDGRQSDLFSRLGF